MNQNDSWKVAITVAVITAIIGPLIVWALTNRGANLQEQALQATIMALETRVAAPVATTKPSAFATIPSNVEPTPVAMTDIPVVVIVPSVASLPTLPPTLTSSPLPTATPVPPTATPEPTSIPFTAPGTVLHDGETWYGKGWSLTVDNFTYKTIRDVHYKLRNLTGRTILFPAFSGDGITMISDTGDTFRSCVPGLGSGIFIFRMEQTEIKSNSVLEWSWPFSPGDACFPYSYSSEAKSLTLTIKNIADVIVDAQWQAEIPRP